MGGAESNVAIGVARLGVPATWIGRLARSRRRPDRAPAPGRAGPLPRAADPAPTAMMLRERRTGTAARVSYYRHGQRGLAPPPADYRSRRRGTGVLHLSGITPALGSEPTAPCGWRCGGPGTPGCRFGRPQLPVPLMGRGTAAPVFRELAAGADILSRATTRPASPSTRRRSARRRSSRRSLTRAGGGDGQLGRQAPGPDRRGADREPAVRCTPSTPSAPATSSSPATSPPASRSRCRRPAVHRRGHRRVRGHRPGDWEAFPPHEPTLLTAEEAVQR